MNKGVHEVWPHGRLFSVYEMAGMEMLPLYKIICEG